MSQHFYFQLKYTSDHKLAYVPAKTKVDPKFQGVSFLEFWEQLKKQGYALKPKQESYEKLLAVAQENQHTTTEDIPVIAARPFMPPREAILQWLNPPHMPPDLVRPKVPFLIFHQARGCVPEKTIFGKMTPFTEEQASLPPGKTIQIDSHFQLAKNGEVSSSWGGQCRIQEDQLIFDPIYIAENVRGENFLDVHFFCSVVVKGDLEGIHKWQVDGDLTVEGFWSANNIYVQGNAYAKGGIQTNSPQDPEKTVEIFGNLEAGFIQSSRFIVHGCVKVDKAITGSVLAVKENLECLGDPGRIVDCELEMEKGYISANGIGGAKDRPAYLKFLTEDGALHSKIISVAEGTRIQIVKNHMIIKFTQAWPPQT